MIAASTLFVLSLIGVAGAINALRPANPDHHPLLRTKWFAQLTVAEAIPARIAVQAVVLVLLVWAGALDHTIGRIGLGLTVLTWVGYGVIQVLALRVRTTMANTLEQAGIDSAGFAHVEWRRALLAYPFRPSEIRRIENIEYAPGLELDLYSKPEQSGPAPALLQIHGGGWSGGRRRQQGRPLVHRLAGRGWVCVSASYSLSPDATYPDHIVDLKRALAWMRNGGRAHGIDPNRIAVTGGSAGGHLASVLALTADVAALQPGFEAEDVSVQAAVPMYGIYDFLNRHSTRDDWPFIPNRVMKARPHEDPERYRLASPIDLVRPEAPPFFVIHGADDSVVPVREARPFVAALKATSRAPVVYAEVPGANHAFDVLDSQRAHYVISAVERFLNSVTSPAPNLPTAGDAS
jgi:acetyl esterase/lipase